MFSGANPGSSEFDGGVEPAIDSGAEPAIDASIGCTTGALSATLDADSLIVAAQNTFVFGSIDALRIDAFGETEALYRFSLEALPTDANIVSMVLTLHSVPRSQQCSAAGTCIECQDLAESGVLELQFLRSDWQESDVKFSERAVGESWEQAGAAAVGVDRSEVITTHLYDGISQASFEFLVGENSAPWIGSELVSFLVTPTESTVLMSTSKESGTFPNCLLDPDEFVLPRLDVKYCQP